MSGHQPEANTRVSVAVLDTSVAVDYFKTPIRKAKIADLLQKFGFTVTTSIGVLEFKATLIQQMITIHDRLVKDRHFTWARDALLESQHSQAKLRTHIFNNILEVFPPPPVEELTPEQDRRLADQAKLKLQVDIERVLHRFRSEVVGGTVDPVIRCDRAREQPKLKKNRVSYESNIPKCQRGKNKSCNVEQVIRDRVARLLEQVIPLDVRAEHTEAAARGEEAQVPDKYIQLCKAWLLVKRVQSDSRIDLNANQCRNCGDPLIAVEAAASEATDAVSNNPREWEPLCKALGINLHRPDYQRDEND